jgi:hypothetical protein
VSEPSAYEWGVAHESCSDALELRSACKGTQRRWWRECPRGDWLLWQLEHGLTAKEYAEIRPAVQRALEHIVDRAVRTHAVGSIIDDWAQRWLSGEDRSTKAAWVAARVGVVSAAWAARAAAVSADAETAAQAAAWAAAQAAAWAAAWAAQAAETVVARVGARLVERRLQARDIRREIPRWIWSVEVRP